MRASVAVLACVLVAALVAWLLVGDDGGDQEPLPDTASRPEQGRTAPASTAADAGKLGALGSRLALAYDVRVIPSRELPRRAPLVSPRERRVHPMTGLEVDLPGRRDGVIYRYPSSDLAAAGATSFLGRHDPFGGVFGCGKNIFFTQARDAEAERWRRRVSAFLTDHDPGCRENQFLVIE